MERRNLQRSTVAKHNESKEHKQSMEAHHMRKQLYGTDVDNSVVREQDQEDLEDTSVHVHESEQHLFRTVHFCALENLPNSMVNVQLNFLKYSGVDPKVTDIHANTVKDVQNSLVHVLNQDMKSRISESKYYGLILDESTDLSIHKKLVIYIRYVFNGEIHTDLIGNVRISDGCSQTIVDEVIGQLRVLGLDIVDLVGLGTDGASVMFGCKNGVGVKLHEDAPFMTHVHCVAHRLSLACSDAAKVVPYLTHYRNTLKNLYIHVTGSGVRQFKLEALQDIMNEPHLRLKDPISIRWLSMEGAVKTIHQCYGSIVAYLQSNEGKNSVGDCIAEGLLKDVTHFKFPAFTAILSDILSVIGVLCRQLQSDSLDLSQFIPMKESAVGKLIGLKSFQGQCEKEFADQLTTSGTKLYYKGIQLNHAQEKAHMDKLKTTYIDSVMSSVEKRLSCDKTPILSAFQLFEPKTLNIMTEEQETLNIHVLAEHFKVDESALKLEYLGMKSLLKGSYSSLTFQQLTKMLITRHIMDFPLSLRICKMGLCIPVSSVACERGFSLQNRIKVKSRTSLNPENLDNLMKIAAGPGLDDFPYNRAIKHWKMQKKRRLARLYQQAKGQ